MTFHAADDSPAGVAAFAPNVQDARASFIDNARYAPLRIGRIITNEIVGWNYTRQPAVDAGLLRGVRGQRRGVCRPGMLVGSHRHRGMLQRDDGRPLTAGTFQPRSVWWAHSLYAAGVASRVAATASTANLVVLGSAGSPAPQVLIGHVNFPRTIDRQPATLVAQLTMNHVSVLPAFASARFAQVQIESIPDSGEAALTAPVPGVVLGQDYQRCARHYLAGDAGRRGAAGDAAATRQRAAQRQRAYRRCRRQRGFSPLVRAGVGPFAQRLRARSRLGPRHGQRVAVAPRRGDQLRRLGSHRHLLRSDEIDNAYGAGAPTPSLRVDAGV